MPSPTMSHLPSMIVVAALLATQTLVTVGCGRGDNSELVEEDLVNTNTASALSPEIIAQESQAASPSDSQSLGVSSDKSATVVVKPPSDQQSLATNPKADSEALSDALFGGPTSPSPRKDLLELQAELPVPRLVDFLKVVDIEMQNVASGRTKMQSNADANDEMIRLAKLKLQASTQLIDKSPSDSEEQVKGLRGQLQSLSHLAALGDLPSAEQLEKLAQENSQSKFASLALDSKLVLVGLAMERLRNGSSKDFGEILDLIDGIAKAPQSPDVSALMVMGQAHALMQQYGDEAAAEKVRETIIDLYADHPNENVAAMATGLAGSPKFSEIDQVLRQFNRGEEVAVDQWRDAIEKLLETSADVTTIQYLAGAALQFEAAGNEPLTQATFEAIAESDKVTGKSADELAVAVEARRARRVAVGEAFAFSGPSVDGRPLTTDSYSGRVVLMPFWAIAIPESLSILQTLDQIRENSDGKVEIVGMNLDTQDAPAADFLQQSPVKFRSFQSVTSPSGANEIAKQFGVVSLPFVVIIDSTGKVAAINLSGRGLSEQVSQFVNQ
jgi:thiol-disulfide isomerase/thioredoxin